MNVSKNVLTDLSGLDTLSHLEGAKFLTDSCNGACGTVLNVSHNRIPRMFGLEGLTSLKVVFRSLGFLMDANDVACRH